jgi:hypothetical protein
MESDVMDLFAEKVFSLSCTETQRVCYAYRDCLRETTDRSIEALCLQGILSFSRIANVAKRVRFMYFHYNTGFWLKL